MSRALVTGVAGFIGSHVADLLIEEGFDVVGIDNLSTGKVENVNPKCSFVNGDITDDKLWATLNDVTPFDYVFHLAARARIQPSIIDPVGSNEVNLTGTLKVLEYCRNNKAKIIFSGSSSVYQGDDLPTKEEYPKEPRSPYALQKFLCEQYIWLYGNLYDIDYAILRYFNVYGERQILDGAYAAIVGIFLDQKKNGKPLTITNDGEQRRDFTYVKDVARANFLAMNWDGVTNVGTGKNISINELAGFVGGEKEYIGERKGEAKQTLADNTRALSNGWAVTKTIQEWVDEQIHT